MRVAILYNAIPEGATLEDQDLLVQVDAVGSALRRSGHEAIPVACTLDLSAMRDELLRLRPAVIFNLVESLAEADSLVHLPHAVLDVLGLPYAGNRTESLFLTTHKLLAKQWLCRDGLPTPPWVESEGGLSPSAHGESGGLSRFSSDGAPTEGWSGTVPFGTGEVVPSPTENASWIIKGVWDQASRGMDDDAVVRGAGPAEVRERLRQRTARTGRPCFAEQFVEGREFNLSMLTASGGPQVLPPAEIDFSAFPPGKPRIVGHRAKWQADSFEYSNTPRRFDFPASDQPLVEELQRLAARCWMLFRLRGWARVDFRVDAAGRPWILEVNANPCLSPDAGFAAALERAGIPWEEAVRRILEEAIP
jgi:D-alanine-D-alanine ligase